MTREELKATFEMIERWPSFPRGPTLFFSSEKQRDEFFSDLVEWVTSQPTSDGGEDELAKGPALP